MKRFGIIYKITNLINGKIYIGQTVNSLEERWGQHVRDSRRKTNENRILSRAIKKYGDVAFKQEVVETVEKSKLDECEIFWIKELKSTCFGNDDGYNMTIGGGGVCGRVQTKEEIQKRIKSCTGKKRSQKTKDLIGKAHKGREILWANKVSEGMTKFLMKNPEQKIKVIERAYLAAEQNKRPVEALMDGVWIEFDSRKDLAKTIGVSASNVSMAISGKLKSVKGFQIRSKNRSNLEDRVKG